VPHQNSMEIVFDIHHQLHAVSSSVNPHRDNTTEHATVEAARVSMLLQLIAKYTDINTDDQNVIAYACRDIPDFASLLAVLIIDMAAALSVVPNVGTLASYAQQNKSQGLTNGDAYAYVSTHGSVTSPHKLTPEDWTSTAWRPSDVVANAESVTDVR
jgi:hypothetical protein